MELPRDPFILLGVINMKLRDGYPSLNALCDDLELNKSELENTLSSAGFEYNEKLNQFK